MDGIDGSTASTLIADSVRRKGADLEALNAGLADTSDSDRWARYLGEWTADWVDRCRRMNRLFPTAIIADGDEDEVTTAFLTRMEQRLRGSE